MHVAGIIMLCFKQAAKASVDKWALLYSPKIKNKSVEWTWGRSFHAH